MSIELSEFVPESLHWVTSEPDPLALRTQEPVYIS
jgi:hypothetical protein